MASNKGATLETLDYTIHIRSVYRTKDIYAHLPAKIVLVAIRQIVVALDFMLWIACGVAITVCLWHRLYKA